MESFCTPSIHYYVKKACGENWRLARARIPFWDLTFVTGGAATYWIDDVPYPVRAGEAVCVPAQSVRRAETRGMECMAFNFSLPAESRWRLPPVVSCSGIRNMPLLLGEFNREWLFYGDLNTLKCRGILLWIMAELERALTQENRHVKKMKEYIAFHMEETITAADVTAQTGLNPVYAGALFRQQENCTILQYVQTLKIGRATQLLQDDAMSVGEIAELLGFSDIGYFSRTFKRKTGQSPQTYRSAKRVERE